MSAWAKEEFHAFQAYTLQSHQALRGGCPAVLTPGQCTHHPRCPHLIRTLQRVVDEVSLPMWMPGRCAGTTPILVRGPGGPRAGAMVAPAPRVEVYNTQYGDVTQVVVPPTMCETVQAPGYHHLKDLYIADHWVVGERALKERAPTRKGIPGLRVWLARQSAVLVPLLRAPTLRWQAAPKDWFPSVVLAHPAEAVIGGRVAKTTKTETVYHRGFAVTVTTPHEGRHGGRKLGTGAPGVLPAPRCAAERHQTAPPRGGPSGCVGAGQCTSARPAMG